MQVPRALIQFSLQTQVSSQNLVLKNLFMQIVLTSIVFGKMNFNVPLPPPYTRQIWGYKKADKKYPERYKNL